MQAVATRHGLTWARRTWGETVSLELLDGQREVFSLQIAPRDFRDIHELCRRGLVTGGECWQLYEQKNPGYATPEAAAKVLHSLERLETQRPLQSIADDRQREEAATVRQWYRDVFCAQQS
jgi:hypothetical protein